MGVGVQEVPAWILALAGGGGEQTALQSCLKVLDISTDARGPAHTESSFWVDDLLSPLPDQLRHHHYACKARPEPHEHFLVVLRLFQYLERHIDNPEALVLQREVTIMPEKQILNLHRFGFCVPAGCAGADDNPATATLRMLILWFILAHGLYVVPHVGLQALGDQDVIVRRCNPGLSFIDHFGFESMFLKQSFDANALAVTIPLSQMAVVEYPKCGGTWLAAMLTIAVENASFAEKHASAQQEQPLVPPRISEFLNITHGNYVHGHPFLLTAPRLHRLFRRHLRTTGSVYSSSQRTLLLVRDPLDVLVSSFYERKYRGPLWNQQHAGEDSWAIDSSLTLEDYASRPEANGSLATYVAFLNNWVPAAERDPSAMVVHYESLLECPMHILGRILNGFAGVGTSCEALRMAVASTTFGRLKAASQYSHDSALVAADPANPNSAKFRRGKAHAAQQELSPQAYNAARRALDQLLPEVRKVFYERARVCYVLGTEGADSRPWEAYTRDITCRNLEWRP